jgi:hypothetical protein
MEQRTRIIKKLTGIEMAVGITIFHREMTPLDVSAIAHPKNKLAA